MGEVLRHQQDESKRRRAERERARPLLRAWLKAVDAKINTKLLGEFQGRLARKLTNYPSANVGKCWVGQDRLAADLGKSRRTVAAALNDLKAAGLLMGKRGAPGKTATHWFAIDR